MYQLHFESKFYGRSFQTFRLNIFITFEQIITTILPFKDLELSWKLKYENVTASSENKNICHLFPHVELLSLKIKTFKWLEIENGVSKMHGLGPTEYYTE